MSWDENVLPALCSLLSMRFYAPNCKCYFLVCNVSVLNRMAYVGHFCAIRSFPSSKIKKYASGINSKQNIAAKWTFNSWPELLSQSASVYYH